MNLVSNHLIKYSSTVRRISSSSIRCTQTTFDNFTPKNKCGYNHQQQYFCCSIATCDFFCARNALKHMIKKSLILFLSQIKAKIAKTIPMMMTVFRNPMIQMMMWPLKEIIFSKNNQNNHGYINDLDDLLECVTQLTLNLIIYQKLILRILLRLVFFEEKR